MVKQFQAFKTDKGDNFGSSLTYRFALFLSVITLSSPALSQFKSRVDIGLAGDLYLTKENGNNAQTHAGLLVENRKEASYFFLDIGAGGLVGESGHTYIKAPELYFRSGKESRTHLFIGRVKKQWSRVDDSWSMGLVEPLFLWDSARPEKQGLSGLFLDMPFKNFNLTLFASFFYLPTQGVSYENSNGKLISSNPWFADPIEAVNFGGQKFDLNYEVDVPDASSVVFQPSVGISLKSKKESQAIWSLFYLNKSKNDFVLPFEGALNGSTLQGDIIVKPRVAQHQVAGIDLGYQFKSLAQMYLSWVYEGGVTYSAPENTTYPEYPDQNIFSATTLFKIFKVHNLWLSYIHTERTKTAVRGVFSTSAVSTFAFRNRFEEAVRLKGDLFIFSRDGEDYKGLLSLSYTYDTVDQGSWVSGAFKWSFNSFFGIYTHCDLFGGPGESIVGNHFISRYQNNDRCLVGGNYAF